MRRREFLPLVGGAAAGELLFILEVMKTEVAHTAPVAGIVAPSIFQSATRSMRINAQSRSNKT